MIKSNNNFVCSNQILYPDIEEREKVSKRHSIVLDKVKDMLENKEIVEEICKIHCEEIESFLDVLETLE